LRQTGTVEAFITEFQWVAMAVTDILEPRLIMLFIEGLHRAFERMGEGIQASHFVGFHPSLSRSGRLGAKD
jgi:hypothetical protein